MKLRQCFLCNYVKRKVIKHNCVNGNTVAPYYRNELFLLIMTVLIKDFFFKCER